MIYSFKFPVEDGGYLEVVTTRPGKYSNLKFFIFLNNLIVETMLGDVAVAVHPEDPRYKVIFKFLIF